MCLGKPTCGHGTLFALSQYGQLKNDILILTEVLPDRCPSVMDNRAHRSQQRGHADRGRFFGGGPRRFSGTAREIPELRTRTRRLSFDRAERPPTDHSYHPEKLTFVGQSQLLVRRTSLTPFPPTAAPPSAQPVGAPALRQVTAAACIQIFAFLQVSHKVVLASNASRQTGSFSTSLMAWLRTWVFDAVNRRRQCGAHRAARATVGHERHRLDRAQADRVGERQLPGQAADHGVERIDAHAFFGVFVEPNVEQLDEIIGDRRRVVGVRRVGRQMSNCFMPSSSATKAKTRSGSVPGLQTEISPGSVLAARSRSSPCSVCAIVPRPLSPPGICR